MWTWKPIRPAHPRDALLRAARAEAQAGLRGLQKSAHLQETPPQGAHPAVRQVRRKLRQRIGNAAVPVQVAAGSAGIWKSTHLVTGSAGNPLAARMGVKKRSRP